MLAERLQAALDLQDVRDRLPARLQVQDPQDPDSAGLVISAWSGTVARVLARGPNLLERDFDLALEAVLAGVILKLEHALYPEQIEVGGARSYLVAEFLGLLEDVGKVSDARRGGVTGTGDLAGSFSLSRLPSATSTPVTPCS